MDGEDVKAEASTGGRYETGSCALFELIRGPAGVVTERDFRFVALCRRFAVDPSLSLEEKLEGLSLQLLCQKLAIDLQAINDQQLTQIHRVVGAFCHQLSIDRDRPFAEKLVLISFSLLGEQPEVYLSSGGLWFGSLIFADPAEERLAQFCRKRGLDFGNPHERALALKWVSSNGGYGQKVSEPGKPGARRKDRLANPPPNRLLMPAWSSATVAEKEAAELLDDLDISRAKAAEDKGIPADKITDTCAMCWMLYGRYKPAPSRDGEFDILKQRVNRARRLLGRQLRTKKA